METFPLPDSNLPSLGRQLQASLLKRTGLRFRPAVLNPFTKAPIQVDLLASNTAILLEHEYSLERAASIPAVVSALLQGGYRVVRVSTSKSKSASPAVIKVRPPAPGSRIPWCEGVSHKVACTLPASPSRAPFEVRCVNEYEQQICDALSRRTGLFVRPAALPVPHTDEGLAYVDALVGDVVVEFDPKSTHGGSRKRIKDRAKADLLLRHGYKVLRLRNGSKLLSLPGYDQLPLPPKSTGITDDWLGKVAERVLELAGSAPKSGSPLAA